MEPRGKVIPSDSAAELNPGLAPVPTNEIITQAKEEEVYVYPEARRTVVLKDAPEVKEPPTLPELQ